MIHKGEGRVLAEAHQPQAQPRQVHREGVLVDPVEAALGDQAAGVDQGLLAMGMAARLQGRPAAPRGSRPAPAVQPESGSSPPGRPPIPSPDRRSSAPGSAQPWACRRSAPARAAGPPPRSAASASGACSGCRCGAVLRWAGTPGCRRPGAHRTDADRCRGARASSSSVSSQASFRAVADLAGRLVWASSSSHVLRLPPSRASSCSRSTAVVICFLAPWGLLLRPMQRPAMRRTA